MTDRFEAEARELHGPAPDSPVANLQWTQRVTRTAQALRKAEARALREAAGEVLNDESMVTPLYDQLRAMAEKRERGDR